MDTIAENMANATTLFNAKGENIPYRRKFAMFAPGHRDDPSKPGVHVMKIDEDPSALSDQVRHEPGRPDAMDKNGNIQLLQR